MPSELEERLRGLYRRSGAAAGGDPLEGQREHQAAHEDALVAALRSRGGAAASVGHARGSERRREHRPDHRWFRRWFRVPRFALAGALGLAVAVGACVMPAEYPVQLGYGFEIIVDPADVGGVDALDPDAIARWLHHHEAVDRVELMVAMHRRELEVPQGASVVRDEMKLRMFVAGDALDSDALVDDLRQEFPALARAELRDAPLSGIVHGTVGGKLSHDLLDLDIDRDGFEEAERRILEQLRADGIDVDHATVDITHQQGADGQHRIEVRVEAEASSP